LRPARFLWLLFVPAVLYSQVRVDRLTGPFHAGREVLYLWSAKHVRLLFPGFENLAADIYWLRTVQYYGGQRLFAREKSFELLSPLIDITTTLDPRLEIAYRYGAIFLSEPVPFGAGRPHDGVALLERGVRALPSSWRLRQDLGFFEFLYLRDAKRASEVLRDASDIPGAPFWLRSMAADVLTKGGERGMSRRMWQEMYQQAEEGVFKVNARTQLQVLDALDQADSLTQLVKHYEARSGRRPASLDELIHAGMLRVSPADPAGIPFVYDRMSGIVGVSPSSPLWRPAG
jgi:hypothetical protein